MCSVSDEAKYCKATSATHQAQSSRESKQPKLLSANTYIQIKRGFQLER